MITGLPRFSIKAVAPANEPTAGRAGRFNQLPQIREERVELRCEILEPSENQHADIEEASAMMGLLIAGCCAIAGVLVCVRASRSRRLFREEERRSLNRQLAIQAEYLRQLEKQAEEARRIRHDYRQHVRVISELASGGNIEGLKRYAQSIDTQCMQPNQVRLTANAELDALLRYYERSVSDTSIDFKTKLALPENLGMPSADVGIVLGNLLENAVDAALDCENAAIGLTTQKEHVAHVRHPYIFVGGQMRAGMLVFTIDNTCTGDVWELGGRFVSTKHKGPGLGIPSAKHAVESRGGVFSATCDGNVFKVLVGIPLAQTVESAQKHGAVVAAERATEERAALSL